jgi:integral membrane protein (TIGR01906 family)
MKLRIPETIASWLFMLCLPVLLLTANIAATVNSTWLYQCGFQRHDVSQNTGIAEEELHRIASGLTGYFNSGEEYIIINVEKDGEPSPLFNKQEVAHLKDVKGLIRLNYTVLLWTFVYSLVYAITALLWQRRRHWRQLAQGLVGGGGITLALMLALGLGTLLGFEQLFLQFHLLSFANDLWQLDPTRDYLIMLFPEGFWFDTFLLWTLLTAFGAMVLGGLGGLYLRRTGGQTARGFTAWKEGRN